MKLIERHLRPRPRSVAEARHALEEIRGSVPEQDYEDLQLLVSEVVSNVVKHGDLDPDDRLHVSVALEDGCVHVEVAQPGPAFVTPAFEQRDWRDSGWGLHLLDLLTTRWGIRTEPTRVWFEMDCSEADPKSRSEWPHPRPRPGTR